MADKKFILSYVGPDYDAKGDPVDYLARELMERGMSGARTFVRESETGNAEDLWKCSFEIRKDDFTITSSQSNKLEIEAGTVEGVEQGRKFIVRLSHYHNTRDYLLEEIVPKKMGGSRQNGR